MTVQVIGPAGPTFRDGNVWMTAENCTFLEVTTRAAECSIRSVEKVKGPVAGVEFPGRGPLAREPPVPPFPPDPRVVVRVVPTVVLVVVGVVAIVVVVVVVAAGTVVVVELGGDPADVDPAPKSLTNAA